MGEYGDVHVFYCLFVDFLEDGLTGIIHWYYFYQRFRNLHPNAGMSNTEEFMNRGLLRTAGPYLCTVLFAIVSGVAHAQVEQGRFVGQITDPQGAVIPGASVKLTNVGTNIVQPIADAGRQL